MAERLPDTLHSPNQLTALAEEVSRLRDWRRDAAIRGKAGLRLPPRPELSLELRQLFPDLVGSELHDSSLKEALDRLAGLQQGCPVVTVTMSGVPGERTKRTITSWFRQQVAPDVLCRYVADRTVGGGAIVRTASRIFDYSWRRQLLANRDAIPRIVRHV